MLPYLPQRWWCYPEAAGPGGRFSGALVQLRAARKQLAFASHLPRALPS